MSIDTVSRAYLVAGLRIGRDVDGFVDSYYGPEEVRDEADNLASAEQALERLDRAIESLETGARRDYFEAQARAMRTVLASLSGQYMPYRDEVEATFGVRPASVDTTEFAEAHQILDLMLPGSGSLQKRREKYREQFVLDRESVLSVAEQLMTVLRQRTQAIASLPDGESAHIELVSDKPWSGYNWYLGGYQSRIEINTDLPVRLNTLPDLVAHEIYCGHHTEHSLKELHFWHEQGYGESAIALLISPQAVISEGIATSAFETLVDPEEQETWLQEHCYGPAGMKVDIKKDLAIQRAARVLRYVDGNAALLLHEEQRSEDEVVDYIVEYGLKNEAEARQTVRFLTTPILRTYSFTYTSGYELVTSYLNRAPDRQAALRSLLTEHWTPARLHPESGTSELH